MSEEVEPANFVKDLEAMMGPLMKESDEVCREVWSAMANVNWYHPKTKSEGGASFRAAGGIIADIIGRGDYLDWYCCGPYAVVTEQIARRMKKAGWIADTLPTICDAPDCFENAGIFYWHEDKSRHSCGAHYEGDLFKKNK